MTAFNTIQPTLQERKCWAQLEPSLRKGLCAKVGGPAWKPFPKLMWDDSHRACQEIGKAWKCFTGNTQSS